MIKLMAIGNLGKDAIAKNVNGKTVINFNVAHTENYTDGQGAKMQKTTWVECAWWTDRTKIVPYMLKGTQVYVEGQPEVRSWEKDGKTGVTLHCRVFAVQLLGSKKDASAAPSNGSEDASTVASDVSGPSTGTGVDDDLPF